MFPWTSGIEWDDKPGWSARMGSAGHEACELDKFDADALEKKYSLTKRQVDITRAMYGEYRKWVDANPDAAKVRKEIAVYYDPRDGSVGELGHVQHRDYSGAPSGAFTATIDLLYEDFRLDFSDIKTGWAPSSPEKSDQMMFIGLVVSKLRNKSTVWAGILALKERGHNLMTAELGELTLGVMESEVKRVHLEIANKKGPTPGYDHCKYCPVNKRCPAALIEEKK